MLSKLFIKKIKENLLLEKKTLLSKAALESDIDDVDMDGDETDEIQGNMLIELQNKLNIRTLDRVFSIDSSLKKIENLSYGTCEECGDLISEKRLLINPCFETCIACAEDKEAEEKQRKRL